MEAEDREKFIKVFSDLPEHLRKEIVAVIDDKPYSWNAAYVEVYNKTELGLKILRQMQKGGVI